MTSIKNLSDKQRQEIIRNQLEERRFITELRQKFGFLDIQSKSSKFIKSNNKKIK